jgi:ABC-2 type transport system ATP-binding protein
LPRPVCFPKLTAILNCKPLEEIAPVAGHAQLLEVADLVRDFGPIRAVDGLSFAVKQGEIVGLLGPNGAGKTTVMRMLVGYLIPTAGTINLAGGDIYREGPRLKDRLGYLPENVPLYGEMTVREYLALVAELKGIADAARRGTLDRVAGLLGLEEMWGRPTSQLSRGYRQRVGLAQAILADPALLILDEPATGLDPNQIAELRHLIRTWRESKAILLSTHILGEALMLCDRVLILSRGRLVAAGTPQALAGPGDGAVATRITVRGGADAEPLEGFSGMATLRAQPGEQVGTQRVWRLEGSLDRQVRLGLMAHLAGGGWEVLEWSSGVSALEQAFRRLTLEEGDEHRG